MNKKTIFLVLIVLLAQIVLGAVPDPGHAASSVGPGTFDSGNFVFQGSVTVDTLLSNAGANITINPDDGGINIQGTIYDSTGSVDFGDNVLILISSGIALVIDQNSDDLGISVSSDATTLTKYGITVTTGKGAIAFDARTNGSNYVGLARPADDSNGAHLFYQNLDSGQTGGPLVKFWSDNEGNDQPTALIDHDGDSIAFDIDSESTTNPAINIQDMLSNISLAIVSGDKICLDYPVCNATVYHNGSDIIIE